MKEYYNKTEINSKKSFKFIKYIGSGKVSVFKLIKIKVPMRFWF